MYVNTLASGYGAQAPGSTRIASGMPTLPGDTDPSDGVYRIEDARAWLLKEQAALGSEIGNIFRQHGISVPPEAVLATEPESGRVTVANAHPDKAKIEALFANSQELHQRYKALTATAELVRAADTGQNGHSANLIVGGNDVAELLFTRSGGVTA